MAWGGAGVLFPLDAFGSGDVGLAGCEAQKHRVHRCNAEPLCGRGARLGRWREAELVTDCPSNGTFWVVGMLKRPVTKRNAGDSLCRLRHSLLEVCVCGGGGDPG